MWEHVGSQRSTPPNGGDVATERNGEAALGWRNPSPEAGTSPTSGASSGAPMPQSENSAPLTGAEFLCIPTAVTAGVFFALFTQMWFAQAVLRFFTIFMLAI